jgi:hypothetical protein
MKKIMLLTGLLVIAVLVVPSYAEKGGKVKLPAGLAVYDGSGLFVGIYIERDGYDYVVYNPDLQGFFRVHTAWFPIYTGAYFSFSGVYFGPNDSSCSGQWYILHREAGGLQSLLRKMPEMTPYMADVTQSPIPAGTTLYCSSDGGVTCNACGPYNEYAYPIMPIETEWLDKLLQYPVLVKPY